MSRYVAAYDVRDSRRRTRLAKLLERRGVRLSESVFELDLEPQNIDAFLVHVGSELSRCDVFDLIPIDRDPRRPRLRWGPGDGLGPPVDAL